MLKGSDVIGLPVIAMDCARQISKVDDLMVNCQDDQVVGLLIGPPYLNGKSWTKRVVLPPSCISVLSVVIPSCDLVSELELKSQATLQWTLRSLRRRTKICATDGRKLGTLTDLHFDADTGKILGYEVSKGYFADLWAGRSFVPAEATLSVSKRIALVATETADAMETRMAGIGCKMRHVAKTARHAIARELVRFTRGRRVRREVRGCKGRLVACQNQIITDLVLARAHAACQEEALLHAAGMSIGRATLETPRLWLNNIVAKLPRGSNRGHNRMTNDE